MRRRMDSRSWGRCFELWVLESSFRRNVKSAWFSLKNVSSEGNECSGFGVNSFSFAYEILSIEWG